MAVAVVGQVLLLGVVQKELANELFVNSDWCSSRPSCSVPVLSFACALTVRMGKQRDAASAVSSGSISKKQKGAAIPDVADMGSLVRGGNKSSKLVPDNCIRMGLYEYAKQGSL